MNILPMSQHSFPSDPSYPLERDLSDLFPCRQYSEAADQLAASVVQRTACLTSVADVPLAGFHIGIGDAFDATFGDVFGWFSPGQGTIPKADLDLETNTDAVMRVFLHPTPSIFARSISHFCRKLRTICSF